MALLRSKTQLVVFAGPDSTGSASLQAVPVENIAKPDVLVVESADRWKVKKQKNESRGEGSLAPSPRTQGDDEIPYDLNVARATNGKLPGLNPSTHLLPKPLRWL